MDPINVRRAVFVYEAARLAAIAAEAPIVPVPWAEREQAFKDQFLNVIACQCGELRSPMRSRSAEELHETWMQAYLAMGWVYGAQYDREAKRHPDLVPYAELGTLEREKDDVFFALCEIARLWIHPAEGAEVVVPEKLCGKHDTHAKRLHEALVAVLGAEAWEDPLTKVKQTVAEWIAGDPAVELARAALSAYNKEPR